MTREDVLEELKEIRFNLNYKVNGTSRFDEALDMAIKAVEAEAESRISYVQEAVNTIMNTCDTDSIKDKAMRNAAKFVQNAIDGSYPEFEKLPKWIPVSERLPEDNTLVLVTVKVGNREPKVRSGYYYMNGHFHIDNGDCWEARDKELIAWMPLPKPYKAESE